MGYCGTNLKWVLEFITDPSHHRFKKFPVLPKNLEERGGQAGGTTLSLNTINDLGRRGRWNCGDVPRYWVRRAREDVRVRRGVRGLRQV
jgi:hypothetical protein